MGLNIFLYDVPMIFVLTKKPQVDPSIYLFSYKHLIFVLFLPSIYLYSIKTMKYLLNTLYIFHQTNTIYKFLHTKRQT